MIFPHNLFFFTKTIAKKIINCHRFDSERLGLFYILISFYGKSLIELLKKHSVSLVWEQQWDGKLKF